MAKKGAGDTVTTRLDPATEEYRKKIFDAAEQAAQQGYTPYGGQTVAGASDLSTGAADAFRRGGSIFDLGINAISGDQAAFSQFMNPFEENVVDRFSADASRLAGMARNDIGDQAALSGAFGGDRHGIAEGTATGDVFRGAADRIAQLRAQGFSDAQARAFQAANLGFGINNAAFQAGDYFRNIEQDYLTDEKNRFIEARDWDLRNLGILNSGLTGLPYGQSQTTPSASNPLMSAGGGALAGYGVAGPPGAVVGGIYGLFGG